MVVAVQMVRLAREAGVELRGSDGLAKQFIKNVREAALIGEMNGHLGQSKHQKSQAGRVVNEVVPGFGMGLSV